MCQFFSCIIDKNKKVYWKKGVNNHHELIEIFNLDDSKSLPDEMKIAKIEITPSKKFPFELDKWVFEIDERYRPIWFTTAHEEACKKVLKECAGNIKIHFPGDLYLKGYNDPLPERLNSVRNLYLNGYKHPLPETLKKLRIVDLNGYDHKLPKTLEIVKYLYLDGYKHPLPKTLKYIRCFYLKGYNHPLPEVLQK